MNLLQSLLVGTIVPTVLQLPLRADILAQWTFEQPNTPPAIEGGTAIGPLTPTLGSGVALGSHASSITKWGPVIGNGSLSALTSDHWSTGDYYQFSTSTYGFENISLSWDQTRSGTGPAAFDLAWSIDGTTFTVFTDDYALPQVAWNASSVRTQSQFAANLSGVQALNDVQNVFFRIVCAVPPTGATGTSRIDNFTINGVSIPVLSLYWDPSGSTPGLGGDGVWSSSLPAWNDTDQGNNVPLLMDPSGKAIFAGGAGHVTVSGTVLVNRGVEVTVDGYQFTGGSIILGGTAGFAVTNASDTVHVSAGLSGNSGLRKLGSGRLVLSGLNEYLGTTTIQEGTLEITEDHQLGPLTNPIVLAGGTLRTSATLILDAARALSGNGALDIAPGTTLQVDGAATFDTLVLKSSGQLNFTGTGPAIGTLQVEAATTVSSPSGAITVNGLVRTEHEDGTTVFGASIALGTAERTITVVNGSAAVDLQIAGAIISANAGGRLVKEGEGALELLGDNSGLLGGIRMGTAGAAPTSGGMLVVHAENALGTNTFQFNTGTLHAESSVPIVFANAISIGGGQIGEGAVFAGSPLVFTGSATPFRAPGISGFQHRITTYTEVVFAGGLNAATGPGVPSLGLIIGGTGRVVLPNTSNTIAEDITVEGAELTVLGGFPAAPRISVRNGGLLSGATNTDADSGEQLGPVLILSNGAVSPGEALGSVGTLHTHSLTIEGTFQLDLHGTTDGEYDRLSVKGSVSLGGEIAIAISGGYQPTTGDSFSIILNDGFEDPVAGTFSGKPNGSEFVAAGAVFRVAYDGGDGNDVVLTVVPEPAHAGLLGSGLGAFLARRRRRES